MVDMRSRSTEGSNSGRSNSSRSRKLSRVAAQTSIDAKLHEEFDESEDKAHYSSSNRMNYSASSSRVPPQTLSSYLQKIQNGKLIQPFGCLIAVNEQTLAIIAYSENAPEMLDLAPHSVPSIEQQEALCVGMDVSVLFRSPGAAALQKAARFMEINLLNPILVHCKTSGKPFYAILHRTEVALIIDLEPVNPADVPASAAGALKSYKLAAKAISKLQSLPSGNISLLCDVLVKEVSDLTGYDRVMIYKFHEDDHGEVVSEWHRPGLEPYLGLHFPATDVPQASRFLFMKNKVRMICDCNAHPVKVVQDAGQPLNLSGSTLRAPHGCHAQYMANMGSIASLVMSVTINEDDEDLVGDQQKGRKLWGLVVCHHTFPRFVPFPLRYACEFLIQVFGIQINKDVEMAAQMKEKHILETQTVLCDMLLRDSPVAIITRSPNVMDLVMCDGAALYHQKKFWLLGITPSESQLRNIIFWLMENHKESTGLSTTSLLEAGFPGATSLGDAVCGMASIRINSKDFLFWFRSHTAKEIKWGGAKHDADDKDEDRKMHPRSSFKAFLEVVQWQSLPWEDVEMDAIHSLQLILRSAPQNEAEEDSRMIVEVPEEDDGLENQKVNELRVITSEIVRLIETAAVPILAVSTSGYINGWNTKIAELTGLPVDQAIGMPYAELVEKDSFDVMNKMFSNAMAGVEEKNVEIKIKKFGGGERIGSIVLMVSSCCSRDINEDLVGVCFIGQDLTGQKMLMDKYTKLQGDYVGIVRNPSSLLPPIFMTDENGRCTEWNHAMEKLTGLKRESAINQMLLGEVFTVDSFGCQVKDADTMTKMRIMQNTLIAGQDIRRMSFGFYDHYGKKYVEALLSANRKTNSDGRVTGALYFMCLASPELQHALHMQKISEQGAMNAQNKLAYIRQEVSKPLNGIILTQELMDKTSMGAEQKQLLKASVLCQEQLSKIINDSDIESIEECYMDLNSAEFSLGDSLDAVIKQAMALSKERDVNILCDLPPHVSSMQLYGDNLRFQQVLSEFLTNAIRFTPALFGSSIAFGVMARKKRIGSTMQVVHLEFRITHPPPGVPEVMIREMFRQVEGASSEGLGLYISQKLVKIMNGTVHYLRESESSSFIVRIEFPLVNSYDC